MRQRHVLLFALFLLILAPGCAPHRGAPPVGPGAATKADLGPWLVDAQSITYTGLLQYFHCTSSNGDYYTWSAYAGGDSDPCEVDVRNCRRSAAACLNQTAVIKGVMIDRPLPHLPLLVAYEISHAPERPALPLILVQR